MHKADNIALWKGRFSDRISSGLKVEDWCKQNNVSRHAYYYWYRKVQDPLENVTVENVFVELPDMPLQNRMEPKNEGVEITWNGFSFRIKDSQSVPNLPVTALCTLSKPLLYRL